MNHHDGTHASDITAPLLPAQLPSPCHPKASGAAMGKRRLADVWDGTQFNVRTDTPGKAPKATCKLCTRWVQTANGSRMKDHLRKVHPHVLPETPSLPTLHLEITKPGRKTGTSVILGDSQSSPASPLSSATSVASLDDVWPKKLSNREKSRSQALLVYACVCNGWSHNSLQSGPFDSFVRSLRPDFDIPKCGAS